MSERAGFPPPPIKSVVTNRDGTMALAWQQWFGALSGWIQRVKVVVAPVDLPSIPAGGGWWGQVSVLGARRGDFALAAFDPADRDLAVSAQVTADDTVTVWVRNHGAGAVDLGAGTLRVRVEKGR